MNNNIYICDLKECNMYLEMPIMLPCGYTICKEHTEHIEKDSNTYKCCLCKEKHKIPDNGFPCNRKIWDIINNGSHLTGLNKNIYDSLNRLVSIIDEKNAITPDGYISDYFNRLRTKIKTHRDKLIQEIEIKCNEILINLDEHEINAKMITPESNKSYSIEFSKQEILEWRQQIRRHDQADQNLLDRINFNIKSIENDLDKFKSQILMNKNLEFFPLNNNLFGELILTTDNIKLANNIGSLIYTFNGHSEIVYSIQVIEQMNKIFSTSKDKTIKVWDLKTGECLKTLRQEYWDTCLVFSNLHKKLISGSFDKTVKIWCLEKYETIHVLNNISTVLSLCLLSENELACGLGDGSINIWDLNYHKKTKTIEAHKKNVSCLKLTSDLNRLISGSGDMMIKVWDSRTHTLIRELAGHTDSITCLEITFDENLLSGSIDMSLILWNLNTGERLRQIMLDSYLHCLKRISDDFLVIGSGNGRIIIFDLKIFQQIKTYPAHSRYVTDLTLLSNGNLLTASANGQIKLTSFLERKY